MWAQEEPKNMGAYTYVRPRIVPNPLNLTLNPKPYTLNPKPQTLKPEPQTLKPVHSTPRTVEVYARALYFPDHFSILKRPSVPCT